MPDDTLPPLRDVIATHGLQASKKFGQNFILDINVTRRIARSCGSLDDCDVIEIGPGPGGLTRGLLSEGARKVIAIETDNRFRPALDEISAAYPGLLHIIEADALTISLTELTDAPYRIIANLPYNIATPLLIGWLRGGFQTSDTFSEKARAQVWQPSFLSMTLMFQKEVAERIVARPNTRAYGRLAVLANWLTDTDLLFELDRQVFVPPPKVTSAVVHFTPRSAPLAVARAARLEELTAAAFGQRRKMLRASLKQICSQPRKLLAECGIAETARPEEISIEGFCRLACLLDEQKYELENQGRQS